MILGVMSRWQREPLRRTESRVQDYLCLINVLLGTVSVQGGKEGTVLPGHILSLTLRGVKWQA